MDAGRTTLGARTAALTATAMLAFAANSVLARWALEDEAIDPGSYTAVRLLSGALLLVFLVQWRRGSLRSARREGSWLSAGWLFGYAAGFSFAYLTLGAATGALILFGVVQATLMAAALLSGDRPGPVFWLGFAMAGAGLAYLVAPGLSAPDPLGAVLMAGAGVAWALYTLRGRNAADPVAATTGNFMLSVPFAVGLVLVVAATVGSDITGPGLVLAVLSGAVTSGLGYVLWYAALPGLTASQASVVQLVVAPLTAVAAVLLLDEQVSLRLTIATAVILGGVALAIRARTTPTTPRTTPRASGSPKVPPATGQSTMESSEPSVRRS